MHLIKNPSCSYDYRRLIEETRLSTNELIDRKLPERKIFLAPWLQERTITLVSAARGIGKTWFGLSLAVALTHGVPIGEWEVINPTGVLYIDGEMATEDIQQRLKGLTQGKDENGSLCLVSSDFLARNDFPTLSLIKEDCRGGGPLSWLAQPFFAARLSES